MSVAINGAGSITGIDQGFNVTAGSVGVGTDNPTVKLDIVDSGSPNIALRGGSYPSIRYSALDGTTDAEIYYGISGNDLVFNNVNAGPIALKTSNVERLRIESGGGLKFTGQGTSIPVGGILHHTNNNLYVRGGTSGLVLGNQDNTNTIHISESDYIKFETTNGTERLRIDSSGNLLLKTGEIDIQGGNKTVKTSAGFLQVGTSGSHYLSLITAGSQRLNITSDGKVGINDTSPQSLFTVNNGTTDSQCFQVKNDNVGLLIGTYGTGHGSYPREATINGTRTDGGSAPYLRVAGQGGIKLCVDLNSERLRIKSNGHIHIGNPIELADVATTTHTFALSGNSDNTFSCPGSVAISGATAYNTANYAGGGLRFLGKYNSAGQYTTFAHVGGIKENTSDGNYAGALTFHTRNHGGLGAERMRISSNGQVTMPSQPCFWATSNTGGSHTSNGYTGIISNQLEAAYVNVGNHFNTSTGVFTCPVAGVYEFHGQGLIRWQGTAGRAELSFYKNGSNTISRSYGYTWVTGTSDHDNLHVMGYITCAVNDQIDLRVYALDSGVDCYFAQGLGYFAGRLVQ